MKKHTLLSASALALFCCLITSVYGQVKDLSYTISPYGQYVWFDEKSGIDDGFLVGAQLGFGFGQFVELSANYAQGLSLETNLKHFGFDPQKLNCPTLCLVMWTSQDMAVS